MYTDSDFTMAVNATFNLYHYGQIDTINMISASQQKFLSLLLCCYNPMNFGGWATIHKIVADEL